MTAMCASCYAEHAESITARHSRQADKSLIRAPADARELIIAAGAAFIKVKSIEKRTS